MLIVTFLGVGLLCANLFAASFYATLRGESEKETKLGWVAAYPGPKTTVTEYELLLWGNSNPDCIADYRKKRATAESKKFFTYIANTFRRICGGKKSAKAIEKEKKRKRHGQKLVRAAVKDLEKKRDRAKTVEEEEKFEEELAAAEMAAKIANEPTYPCVPPCRSLVKMRSILDDDFSSINLFVTLVVILNVIVLALDSSVYPDGVQHSATVCNYIFSGIYIGEAVIKLTAYGPCMYFSDRWNCFDFFLLIMMLPQYAVPKFRLVNNLRLLRLLRLSRVVKASNNKNQREKVSEYMYPSRVLGLMITMIPYIAGTFAFNLLLMFIFACMGQQFFNGDNFPENIYRVDDYIVYNLSTFTTPDIYESAYLFGGQYVERMNYNNFINSYYTVFNLSMLNFYYQSLIYEIEKFNVGVLGYYFLLLLVCYYLPNATILSSIVTLVELDARRTLTQIAEQNKFTLDRAGVLSSTCQMRKLFRNWKRNTDDSITEVGEGGTSTAGQGAVEKQQRPMVEEVPEEELGAGELAQFFRIRRKSSFYVFSRHGPVRNFLHFFLKLRATNTLILAAVLATTVAVITGQSNQIMNGEGWKQLNRYVAGIFLGEMVLRMIASCVYGTRNAYMYKFLNVLDFVLNFFILLEAFTSLGLIHQLRLLRLLKIPDLLPLILRADTLQNMMVAIRKGFVSFLSVIAVAGVFVFCISIVTMQLYSLRFRYCSDRGYPGGAELFGATPGFPDGCSGTAVESRTNQTLPIHVNLHRDHFDGIFAAGRSIFRVVTRNEFAPIIYNSADVTGDNREPENFASKGWLALWIVVVFFSYTVAFLPAAVIYFHFFCVNATRGRKYIIGENEAFWFTYENRLRMVRPESKASKVDDEIRQNNFLKLFALALVLGPQVYCLVNMYGRGLFKDEIGTVYINAVANTCFILITIYRCSRDITTPPKVDVILSVYLAVANYGLYTHLADSDSPKFGDERVFEFFLKTSMILRYNILALVYKEVECFYKVLFSTCIAMVPILLYSISLVLLYGLVGFDIFEGKDLDVTNGFVEQYVNFETLENTWNLLLAMGSGNYWTGIIQATKFDLPDGAALLVDVYYYSFFVLYYFLLQAIPVLTIYYYGVYYTGMLGIAGQQVKQFQRAWNTHSNKSSHLSYSALVKLIADLPPPLGMKGKHICYVDLAHFARAVISCLPPDERGDMDVDRSKQLFPQGSLPEDLRIFDDEYQKHNKSGIDSKLKEYHYDMTLVELFRKGFTFTQVIIGVHRRVVQNVSVGDGDNFYTRRQAKQHVAIMRLRLGHIITRRLDKQAPDNMPHVPGYTISLQLQKSDTKLHRKLFMEIAENIIKSTSLKIKFFGFSGQEGFYLSKIRLATKKEVNITRRMLQLRDTLLYPGCTQKAIDDHNHLKVYYGHLKGFDHRMDSLYGETADNIWDIDTLYEVAALGDFGTVCAVAVDSHSTIYAAFAKGFIKIWNTSNAEVTEESRFKLHQKLEVPGAARRICVTKKRDQIVAAIGKEVIVYSNRHRRRRQFQELYRFYDHTAVVNTVLFHDTFYISGGQDSRVLLWNMRYTEPLKHYYVGFGTSVFCLEVLTLSDDTTPTEENTLSHVLAVGDSSGYVSLLPLPSHYASTAEYQTSWEACTTLCGESQVTSISFNWGYIYTGFANGVVKTWAISVDKGMLSHPQPIHAITLIPLSKEAVHAAPVTEIFYAGGRLFSTSHDYSVLPWRPPDKMKVTSEANFMQEIDAGKVLHSYPIIAAAANKFLMVTGDEFGKVRITAPGVFSDNIAIGESINDAFSVKVENSVQFSFMRHDFGHCFVSHQDKQMEEEMILVVTNVSAFPLTVRSVPTRNHNFRIERDIKKQHAGAAELTNENLFDETGLAGVHIVPVEVEAHNNKKVQRTAQRIEPFHSARYRIIFKPIFPGKAATTFEFSINERRVVRVHCKGYGVKPKITIENGIKLFDFETQTVGQAYPPLFFYAVNNSPKGTTVFILDDMYPQDADASDQYNMAERQISVEPRVFYIPGQSKQKVELAFNPTRPYKTFSLKLRFAYCGGEYTVADIVARSVERNQEEIILTPTIPYRNPNTIFTEVRKFDVNEAFCCLPVAYQLLYMLGWLLTLKEDVAILFHKQSGMFLEIMAGEGDSTEELSQIEISFENDNAEPCYYKLVRASDKHVLAHGHVEGMGSIMIGYDIDELKSGPSCTFGFEFLELQIFYQSSLTGKTRNMSRYRSSLSALKEQAIIGLSSKTGSTDHGSVVADSNARGEAPNVFNRTLTSVTTASIFSGSEYGKAGISRAKSKPGRHEEPHTVYHIRIQKGFRVHKSPNDLKIHFQPRYNICGIERIVTNLEDKAGAVHEIFGTIPGMHAPKYEIPSARFASVLVMLKGIGGATDYDLKDYLEKPNGEEPSLYAAHSGKFTTVGSIAEKSEGDSLCIESQLLKTPAIPPEMSELENLYYRNLEVKAYDEEFLHSSEKTKKAPRPVVNDVVSCHTACDLIQRAQKSTMSPRDLLPCKVASRSFSVEIGLKNANKNSVLESDVKKLASLLDRMRITNSGDVLELSNPYKIRGLFEDDTWFPVIKKGVLSFISKEFEGDVTPGEEANLTTELTFGVNGVVTRGTRYMRTINTQLTCYSHHEELEYDNHDELENIVRLWNDRGKPEWPQEESKLLVGVWHRMLDDEKVNVVKRAFFHIARKQINDDLNNARLKADAIQKKFDDEIERAMENRPIKRMTAEEMRKQMLMKEEMAKIYDSVAKEVTYREVYREMIKTTEGRNTKKTLLSVSSLQQYLTEKPLEDSAKPFTPAQASLLLRDIPADEAGTISEQFFKKWYESDEGKILASQLTEKTMWPQLLNEELMKMMNGADVDMDEVFRESLGLAEEEEVESAALNDYLNSSFTAEEEAQMTSLESQGGQGLDCESKEADDKDAAEGGAEGGARERIVLNTPALSGDTKQVSPTKKKRSLFRKPVLVMKRTKEKDGDDFKFDDLQFQHEEIEKRVYKKKERMSIWNQNAGVAMIDQLRLGEASGGAGPSTRGMKMPEPAPGQRRLDRNQSMFSKIFARGPKRHRPGLTSNNSSNWRSNAATSQGSAFSMGPYGSSSGTVKKVEDQADVL
jgi:hypothetical protein